MSLRARFFDDWRLSRIDEEVERLSINSDTSVAVESISPSLRAVQRSASAEGVVQSEDDDDDDEPPLPPPPSPLPLAMMKDAELDTKYLRRLDQETEALRFLQVKYDTLGKVNVEKRQIPITSQQQTPSTTSGTGEAAAAAGPQCQLNCDCSLASAGDQRPRMAVDSSSFPQSSTASRGSVAERRKPPPPPSTNRRQCSCPTSASETGSCTDRLHLSADDYRHHHHHHHHQHHHQQQQRHLEQFSHPQHCSQTSSASVRHQSQEGSDGGQPGRLAALCSCHGDPLRRGGSGGSVERQCCPLLLSNAELFQIDLFYRSRKTFVYVCPCPAVLYFASAASAGRGSGGVASSMSWRFAAAGVPVIVVDTMRGASVGSRLHLVLAERGTGFELWRYRLTDGVQQYAVGEASTPGGDGGTASAFHTVTVSTGHVAGLCFDDAVSAGDFHRQLLRIDELYSTGGGGSRNRKGKKTRREVVSGACECVMLTRFKLTQYTLATKSNSTHSTSWPWLRNCICFNL